MIPFGINKSIVYSVVYLANRLFNKLYWVSIKGVNEEIDHFIQRNPLPPVLSNLFKVKLISLQEFKSVGMLYITFGYPTIYYYTTILLQNLDINVEGDD